MTVAAGRSRARAGADAPDPDSGRGDDRRLVAQVAYGLWFAAALCLCLALGLILGAAWSLLGASLALGAAGWDAQR